MNTYTPFKRDPRKKTAAQAMVEFALVLPIVLLVLIGIIEFSRLLYAWLIVENSARFGVRLASTGQYDPTYCVDTNANGPCTDQDDETEIDAARIPTIKDETRRIIAGLHYRYEVAGVTEADDEYLNITVCRGPADTTGYTFTPPQLGSPQYAQCAPEEHPGEPGEQVYVATDYNFRFIVLPIFGIEPSMIHLAAYREGTVEQFRLSRVMNVPPPGAQEIETNTPTLTFTPTITDTPIPTNTPTFTLTPSFTPTPPFTPTPTFTRTITLTPTNSRTPTATPVPSCSNLIASAPTFTSNEFRVNVRNNNVAPAFLINSTLVWNRVGTMNMDYFRFAGNTYFNPRPNLTTSPIGHGAPSIRLNGGGTSQLWLARFGNTPNFQGYYSVTLTFSFPGWGDCTVTSVITQFTPTPSRTATITRTPTITRTRPPTNTPTITRTPSKTPTRTATSPVTFTFTATQRPSATFTPRATNTRPPTNTPSRTPVASPTRTRTRTPTADCSDC